MIIYQSAKISCIKYTLTFNFFAFPSFTDYSYDCYSQVTPVYLHLLWKQLTNITFSTVLFFWKYLEGKSKWR